MQTKHWRKLLDLRQPQLYAEDGDHTGVEFLPLDGHDEPKGMGMLVSRCAATLIVLLMMSVPRLVQGQPAVAPEHQELVAKRAKERERIAGCQKQATEQKILPRDRPQFVINCLNGAAGLSQPSVVAPEYQELAQKRAKEKERVDGCQRQATEQRVLPRDRPQFVIGCLENTAH
jgi:hypothetical protein